jgi:pimeloyl-ACP methyl ester carboxylesterase
MEETKNKIRFVEEFGGAGEVLVLVHGLGGSTNSWYPQATILQKQFRVVGYDLAGSGRTGVHGEISLDTHVADLGEVIGSVAGGASVHLAGHSLGSIICQHFAARYPEKVASLVLVGAFPEPLEAARNALRDRAAKARAEGMAGIANAIVAGGTSDDVKINQPAVTAFVRESIMAQPAEGYARNCEALAALSRADLSRIAAPTLLITGDQDRTAPPDVGRAIASEIRQAEFHLLTACGHWAPVERANQVSYAMTLFYARLARDAAA